MLAAYVAMDPWPQSYPLLNACITPSNNNHIGIANMAHESCWLDPLWLLNNHGKRVYFIPKRF